MNGFNHETDEAKTQSVLTLLFHDTVSAIAGGLAGLYYGYRNIPKEWLETIQKREWIGGMCDAKYCTN